MLEGTQRLDEWQRLRKRIPSNLAVPVSVAEMVPEDPNDRMAKRILELVDDDRTIEEIALHAHTSGYQVCRALFDQLERGTLKIVRPRTIEGAPQAPAPGDRGPVDVDSLVATAQKLIARDEYEGGLRHLRAALSLDPDNAGTQAIMRDAQSRIESRLADDGVHPRAVPHLERSFDQLTGLDITPQEGFILTRINDTYDIQTILKISPMPQLDGLLTFWRLRRAGHIRVESPS